MDIINGLLLLLSRVSKPPEFKPYYCPALDQVELSLSFHDCFQDYQHVELTHKQIVLARQGADIRNQFRKGETP